MTNAITSYNIRTRNLDDLISHGVGWDRWLDTLWADLSAPTTDPKYPPYNIVELPDNKYQVELAVAGFGMEDLKITIAENRLTVEGSKAKEERQYRVRGLAARNFTRTFALSDNVEVRGASLKNGMLLIDLEYVIPDHKKPKTIPIQN